MLGIRKSMTVVTQNKRPGNSNDDPNRWRSLFYFNIYRLVFASVVVALSVYTNVETRTYRFPDLFLATGMTMMVMTLINFVAINQSKPQIETQIHLQGIFDLVFITIFAYSSNGFESGYSILMVVSIASISLLESQRTALAYAAFGTLLVLGESVLSTLYGLNMGLKLQGPAFFGTALFTTAIMVTLLASRVRISEELASRRGAKLASMDMINHQVVELIPTGVMAVDKNNKILICNVRARSLLSLDVSPEGQSIQLVAPEIDKYLRNQQTYPHDSSQRGVEVGQVTMLPSRQQFGDISLIFLEDLSNEQEQARQLRLAAMGRLASSIAHDIRNPLSAIYQSAQLLGESHTLGEEDKSLTRIITTQSERIEHTVESVLMIGRGDLGNREIINLQQWLNDFLFNFCQIEGINSKQIEITGSANAILMDSNHLEQILTNLTQNALAHTDPNRKPSVTIRIANNMDDNKPYIDIIDYGKPISEASRKKLFEPFFTTRSRGTGLGLYISRELCEANHAMLHYRQSSSTQKRFRVTFQPAE